MQSQQPDEAARDGAESDLRVSHAELTGGLPGLDVPQGAWGQAAGCVEEIEAGAGDEPGHFGMRPAEAGGEPQRYGEDLCRVGDAGGGPVDHVAPALEDLARRGLEQLVLALEVVVERSEADVGRLGDLLDAGPFSPPLGDQSDGRVDQSLPGPGLATVQPVVGSAPFADEAVNCRPSFWNSVISSDLMLQRCSLPRPRQTAGAPAAPAVGYWIRGSPAQAALFVLVGETSECTVAVGPGAARCRGRTPSYPRSG